MKIATAKNTRQKTIYYQHSISEEWVKIFLNEEDLVEDMSIACKNGATYISRETDLLEPDVATCFKEMLTSSAAYGELQDLGYSLWTSIQGYHNIRSKKVELTISWEGR